MDPEKQKCLDLVKAGQPCDVNGVRCETVTDVHKAFKDGVDAPAAVLPEGEKPPKTETK